MSTSLADLQPAAPPTRPGLVQEILLAMARQRPGLHASRCRLALDFLDTSARLRPLLRHHFAQERLSAAEFSVLLALYAIDPVPASTTDLAAHTRLSRPEVSKAVASLTREQWVVHEQIQSDRRISYLHLTATGLQRADAAGQSYLRLLGQISRFLPSAQPTRLP